MSSLSGEDEKVERFASTWYLAMGGMPLLGTRGDIAGSAAPFGPALLIAGEVPYSVGVTFISGKIGLTTTLSGMPLLWPGVPTVLIHSFYVFPSMIKLKFS